MIKDFQTVSVVFMSSGIWNSCWMPAEIVLSTALFFPITAIPTIVLSCGYNRFPLVEHDPRYTLIVRDILYWETARSLWTQYLKAIPGKEEKVKRAIRGILADYEKEERDIIYLESKNHCVLVHLDGIRQTPEGSPSFYATLDEAEHEFASSAFLRIHKSYLINGDHILQMSNYKVLLDTGMTLKGSRKYFSKAKLEFYRGR